MTIDNIFYIIIYSMKWKNVYKKLIYLYREESRKWMKEWCKQKEENVIANEQR